MRRRAALALLASSLAGASGCTGTTGDDRTPTPTPTPTTAPTDTSDPPTDTRSVIPDGDKPPSGTPPAGVTPAPGSCSVDRPEAESTGAYDPPAYPDPPARATGEPAREYLGTFERAYVANRLVATESAPEGTVVADASLDARVVATRAGPDWTLAGVAVDGAVGYVQAPTADGEARTDATNTPTRTPTPLPGITVHYRASYYLTGGFLVRQDRGHDGDPPPAVSEGTVVACFGGA
jgi:hypothetical protein